MFATALPAPAKPNVVFNSVSESEAGPGNVVPVLQTNVLSESTLVVPLTLKQAFPSLSAAVPPAFVLMPAQLMLIAALVCEETVDRA